MTAAPSSQSDTVTYYTFRTIFLRAAFPEGFFALFVFLAENTVSTGPIALLFTHFTACLVN